MKWEYLTLTLEGRGWLAAGKFDEQKFANRLNQLGEESWELVSCFDTNISGDTRYIVAVLKRPTT